MAWAKLDDRMKDHRKTRRLIRGNALRGISAFGIHVFGILHSAEYLTDGHVDHDVADETFDLAKVREKDREPVVNLLVEQGLWVPDGAGWKIHDYLEYNPSRADVEERRRKDAERKAAGRGTQSLRRIA